MQIHGRNPWVARAIENTPKNLAILADEEEEDYPLTFGQLVADLAEAKVIDSSSYSGVVQSTSELFTMHLSSFELLLGDHYLTFGQKVELFERAQYCCDMKMKLQAAQDAASEISLLVETVEGKNYEIVEYLNNIMALRTSKAVNDTLLTHTYNISPSDIIAAQQLVTNSEWAISRDKFCDTATLIGASLYGVSMNKENDFIFKDGRHFFMAAFSKYMHSSMEPAYTAEFGDSAYVDALRIMPKDWICEEQVRMVLTLLLAETKIRTKDYSETYYWQKMRSIEETLFITDSDRARLLAKYPLAETVRIQN